MKLGLVISCCLLASVAGAQGRDFTLSAPPEIVETGLLQHLLPRFGLKNGLRVTVVPEGGIAVIGADGVPVFRGLDRVWSLSHDGSDGPLRLEGWLTSEVGIATIAAFRPPEGTAPFTTDLAAPVVVAPTVFDGDVAEGERLSLLRCGRCHVVNETNRMKGMGATPSFALMRTFPDWENRFATFYVLNPHPSFSQVEGITAPFRSDLPPAIVPLSVTQAELDDILSYVATIPPADLGAPLQSQ